VTSSWFFLSTLNYDARSTTHQIQRVVSFCNGFSSTSWEVVLRHSIAMALYPGFHYMPL